MDEDGPPLLEASPAGNTITSESSVAMMPLGLSQSFQPPWLRLGQWRSAKGEREDAWRGARKALGDRVSEKNKVARKWV